MRALVLAAFALACAAPSVAAGHGAYLWGVAEMADGATVHYVASYWTGAGDDQLWEFDFDRALECFAHGSLEAGFDGGACFRAGGTGDAHEYPWPADAHEVALELQGRPGWARQVSVG